MSCCGLFKRKETWVLTWRARALVLVVFIVALFAFSWMIYPFLAVTEPAYGEVLVVEGRLPYAAFQQAAEFFNKHQYQVLVTTGGPREETLCFPEYPSYAEYAAALLKQLGVKSNRIVAVPKESVRRDRTSRCVTGCGSRVCPSNRWTCSPWVPTRAGHNGCSGWRSETRSAWV